MAKQQENVLGLDQPWPEAQLERALVPLGGGHSLTRDERRVETELHKQLIVMQATAIKGIYGRSQIEEVHKHAAVGYDETAEYIVTLRNTARGKDHELYVNQFCDVQMKALARHTLGMVEVIATHIGYEANRSLYPEPLGFWGRVLGS
jgi:hypothetical protein